MFSTLLSFVTLIILTLGAPEVDDTGNTAPRAAHKSINVKLSAHSAAHHTISSYTSLLTKFINNNRQRGIYFNIKTKNNAVNIGSFDISYTTSSRDIELRVFKLKQPNVDYATALRDSSKWELVHSIVLNKPFYQTGNIGIITPNVYIAANCLQGFYLSFTTTNGILQYSNGPSGSVGGTSIVKEDNNIAVTMGHGSELLFNNNIFHPREPNVIVYYKTVAATHDCNGNLLSDECPCWSNITNADNYCSTVCCEVGGKIESKDKSTVYELDYDKKECRMKQNGGTLQTFSLTTDKMYDDCVEKFADMTQDITCELTDNYLAIKKMYHEFINIYNETDTFFVIVYGIFLFMLIMVAFCIVYQIGKKFCSLFKPAKSPGYQTVFIKDSGTSTSGTEVI